MSPRRAASPALSIPSLAFALVSVSCHSSAPAPAPETAPDPAAASLASGHASPGDPSIVSIASASESEGQAGQTEPTLTVAQDGRVAVAWMSAGAVRASIGVRFSSDVGATWTPVQSVRSADQRSATDPALATDLAGNVYLAWLANGPDGPGAVADSHVYVARADAPGAAFGPALDVSERMHRGAKLAKPWLAATSSGAIVATWSYESSLGDGIGVARSVDGKTWTRESAIERIGLHASLPFVCASTHGDRVWVTYLDPEAGVRARASDDGGVSWSAGRGATVSTADERARIAPEAPSCAGDGEEITVAYGLLHDAKSTVVDSIVVAKSYDGGRVFDSRRILGLDGDTTALLHPQLAREYDGALDLAYYAAGAMPETGTLRWIRAEGARSPLAPSRVARTNSRFEPARDQRGWPGDYFGWAWRAGVVYAASIDNATDIPHVAFTHLATR